MCLEAVCTDDNGADYKDWQMMGNSWLHSLFRTLCQIAK